MSCYIYQLNAIHFVHASTSISSHSSLCNYRYYTHARVHACTHAHSLKDVCITDHLHILQYSYLRDTWWESEHLLKRIFMGKYFGMTYSSSSSSGHKVMTSDFWQVSHQGVVLSTQCLQSCWHDVTIFIYTVITFFNCIFFKFF